MTIEPDRAVVSAYTWIAPVYDVWTCLTETQSLYAALEEAAIRDGEAVLEVAVGTGVSFRAILDRNPTGRNVGVDLTDAMIRRARRKARRSSTPFHLTVADARALPFGDGSFDLVTSSNMLALVGDADIRVILREMRRVLRPGGRLVLTTMVRPASPPATWLYDVGAVRLGRWRDIELAPFVHTAGYDVVHRRRVVQLGVPSEILVARRPTG